jgi:hypothetical protein
LASFDAALQAGALAKQRVTPISSSGLVSDRSQLDETLLPNGQQKSYLVLSEEERAKGFVRPVRTAYLHVGVAGPKHPTRDVTDEERTRYGWGTGPDEFTKFEVYPEGANGEGRYWTQNDLDKVGRGCGTRTTMALPLAETYARKPGFYGGTFCCGCRTHLPVGADGEFVWEDGSRVGT